jgi:hypothetical protein
LYIEVEHWSFPNEARDIKVIEKYNFP